jgi:hypothetical protein
MNGVFAFTVKNIESHLNGEKMITTEYWVASHNTEMLRTGAQLRRAKGTRDLGILDGNRHICQAITCIFVIKL